MVHVVAARWGREGALGCRGGGTQVAAAIFQRGGVHLSGVGMWHVRIQHLHVARCLACARAPTAAENGHPCAACWLALPALRCRAQAAPFPMQRADERLLCVESAPLPPRPAQEGVRAP